MSFNSILLCLLCLLSLVCCCCFNIIYYFCFYNYFIRDVRQPLSQIRLTVSMSLGAGQIIFLAGINTTESKVSVLPFYPWNELTLCTVNILSKDENIKNLSLHRLPVLQQQLWCSISWWPLSLRCWSREFLSTSPLRKFATSTLRFTCITSFRGNCNHAFGSPNMVLSCSKVFGFPSFLMVGLPVIMVAISLGFPAGKEGLQSYTSDK